MISCTEKEYQKRGELIDLGVKAEVVEKSGSWYSYGNERIGQGRENVRLFLKDNPDIAAELEHKIRVNEGLLEDELLMPKDERRYQKMTLIENISTLS